MDRDDIDAFADEWAPDDDVYVPDGFDDAFLGITSHIDPPAAIYSIEKCIEILARNMTKDAATDHFYFNVISASPSPGGAIFINVAEE
tara:strand:+ start:3566 stop:3829 length:264 start_codon:yes stop_codon:yes gene_type:complete